MCWVKDEEFTCGHTVVYAGGCYPGKEESCYGIRDAATRISPFKCPKCTAAEEERLREEEEKRKADEEKQKEEGEKAKGSEETKA